MENEENVVEFESLLVRWHPAKKMNYQGNSNFVLFLSCPGHVVEAQGLGRSLCSLPTCSSAVQGVLLKPRASLGVSVLLFPPYLFQELLFLSCPGRIVKA
jgi:hypothetical protein